MTYRPVLVVWHDAFSDVSGWSEVVDMDDEPCVVESVGYLVPDAKNGHVVVAQSVNSNGQMDSVLCVPVAMVQRVVLLS